MVGVSTDRNTSDNGFLLLCGFRKEDNEIFPNGKPKLHSKIPKIQFKKYTEINTMFPLVLKSNLVLEIISKRKTFRLEFKREYLMLT
jgi:hypothetical protein